MWNSLSFKSKSLAGLSGVLVLSAVGCGAPGTEGTQASPSTNRERYVRVACGPSTGGEVRTETKDGEIFELSITQDLELEWSLSGPTARWAYAAFRDGKLMPAPRRAESYFGRRGEAFCALAFDAQVSRVAGRDDRDPRGFRPVPTGTKVRFKLMPGLQSIELDPQDPNLNAGYPPLWRKTAVAVSGWAGLREVVCYFPGPSGKREDGIRARPAPSIRWTQLMTNSLPMNSVALQGCGSEPAETPGPVASPAVSPTPAATLTPSPSN
jgi:hypothetical protein